VVVVSHDGCAWYQKERLIPAFVLKFGHEDTSYAERQKRNLVAVVSSLRQLLPATQVEANFAAESRRRFPELQSAVTSGNTEAPGRPLEFEAPGDHSHVAQWILYGTRTLCQ
jgi:hypothetical protein